MSSEGTRLKQEGRRMSCTRTSLMPRTPATTCRASMCATVTSWFSTTTQTEYVGAERADEPCSCLHKSNNKNQSCHSFTSLSFSAGVPENGHKEERGAAEAFKREVRHQHGPPQVEKPPPVNFYFQAFASNVTLLTVFIPLLWLLMSEFS